MNKQWLLRAPCTAAMLLAWAAGSTMAQQAPGATQAPGSASATETEAGQTPPATATPAGDGSAKKKIRGSDRRRAAKLYLEATKLFEKEQFDAAMRDYEQAAALDPDNTNYPLAAQITRSHAVMESIQAAAKARMQGDYPTERASLQRALELEPGNVQATEHLRQMADDAVAGQAQPMYEQGVKALGDVPALMPTAGTHTFHLRSDRRQLIQTVFRAYGIEATLDRSVPGTPVKFDLEDATFGQAMDAIGLATTTFAIPLDAHRAIVARETRDNRQQFMRQELETVYLPGLTATELTEVGTLARNVFQIQQVATEQSAGTLTLRAPSSALNAFNATMRGLLDGRSQVMLEVRLIQLAHTSMRNTGVQPPQQVTAFNVYAEEQSILNANQALVQEIISSGLAAPGDTLAILGILLASGQVSSALFQNGIALFGGGLTLSGISPGPVSMNLSLNSSDSRELDDIQLRLGDGEEGTVKTGMRYPITTSSFSNLGTGGLNIPGLSTPGNSGSLSSLLSSLNGAQPNIPQVEYQDLGLTFKTTPRVIRSGEIALTIDMKITALSGSSLNSVPVLNNRSYSGVVTVRDGAGVVLASDMDKEETRAISGVPGLSEIPGLNNASEKDVQKNYASLLIVITPHVIRGTQAAGHSAMMRIERGQVTP
jgi:general secretion pathway protein D